MLVHPPEGVQQRLSNGARLSRDTLVPTGAGQTQELVECDAPLTSSVSQIPRQTCKSVYRDKSNHPPQDWAHSDYRPRLEPGVASPVAFPEVTQAACR